MVKALSRGVPVHLRHHEPARNVADVTSAAEEGAQRDIEHGGMAGGVTSSPPAGSGIRDPGSRIPGRSAIKLHVMADANGSPDDTDPGGAAVTDPAVLRRLVARSGELKRALIAFAEGPRFDRWRVPELARASRQAGAAGAPDGAPPAKGSERWITAMDDFIMTFRFPDGTGVIDRFLSAGGKNLTRRDRRLCEGWRDPVDGIFELRASGGDPPPLRKLTLWNLLDELEYQAYSELSLAGLSAAPGDFILARLVPVMPGSWTFSGSLTPIPRAHAKVVAELALEWSASRPRLVFRNPEKVRQGWELMRREREEFIEFFGADQVVIPVAEAEGRIDGYYRARQRRALAGRSPDGPLPAAIADAGRPFFVMPESLRSLDTIGVIFDETDGLSLLPDFGMLTELFARPELAADKRYAEALLGYLGSGSIAPGVLRRLAAAHPDTADVVFRTVLKRPSFTWASHGDLLLRRSKPWYYKQVRYPAVSPVSDYLLGLASGRE